MPSKRHAQDPSVPVPAEDAFIADQDAAESGQDDDDDDDKPKDKKAGRRKIKIEFIQDKSRRHITFSKRKAGIMKKAYELSTLTGTQVLLLVVSETGLVYTFTTAKLQPLVTQPEGKNLIQACLNAPHGTLPSSMPVGPPISRTNNVPVAQPNVPGGLSIGAGSKDDEQQEGEGDEHNGSGDPPERARKRRRGSTSAGASGSRPNASPPIPVAGSGVPPASTAGGPTTSPHARTNMLPGGAPPPALSIPGAPGSAPIPLEHSPRQGQATPTSPNYAQPPAGYQQHQGGDPAMYGAPPQHQGYPGAPPQQYPGFAHDGSAQPQQPGLVGAHGGAWAAAPVQQGQHYGRR